MQYFKINIDFEIIWRKLNSYISDEEEVTLKNWLEQDKRHQAFFKNAEKIYKNKGDIYENPINSNIAWKNVNVKIKSGRKAKSYRLPVLISSIAASVVIILYLYSLLPGKENSDLEGLSLQTINPGTNKALLILDDGSIHDLSKEKNIEFDEGGSRVYSQGTSLLYTKKNNPGKEIKYNTLKIPRGGEFFLTLSDSTKVWLNSESTLRYPVLFKGNERVVELTGEAFFEVKKDGYKPFKVLSEKQIVEVLGTSFNITSYETDSLIFTTLVEGNVAVFHKDKPGVKLILEPNHQSYMFKNKGLLSKREINVEPFIAWKEGRFCFKNQSLNEMMKTLARWYDVEVLFENETVKEIAFTGNLKRYDNLEKILILIEKTNEVKFRIENKIIHVL